MFATRLNKQLLVYVSPCPDPQAFDTDALSMDWDILPFLYLFPPSPIVPMVLQKVKQSDNTFLVITPQWPHQSCVSHRGKIFWFRTYLRGFGFTPIRVCSNTMLGCCPRAPPNSRFFGDHCDRIALPQRNSTGFLYNAKWEEFCRCCHRLKADPVSADVLLAAECLELLFQRTPPLAIDTIRGFRSITWWT